MSELMELQKVEPVVFTEAKQLETEEDTKEDIKDVVVEPKEELTEPKTEEDADPLAGGINIDDDELKETLDELQCIKKELADIKKDPVAIDNATGSDDNKEKIKKEEDDKKDIKEEDPDTTTTNEPSPDDSLGRDDLIAMLKGCEETQEKSVTTNAKPSDLTEDVEIEGEGSFQIMEVVDDDLEPDGDEIEAPSTAPPLTTTKTTANVAATAPKLPTSTSGNVKTITLTLEQERAIAMEQMADISAKRIPRSKAPAATSAAAAPAPATVAPAAEIGKEEKKVPEPDKTSLSLLQVLGADWSDDDAHHDKATKLQTKAVTSTKPKVATKSIKKEPISTNKAATTIAVVTKDTTTVVKASAAAKTKSIELEQQQKTKEKPVITSVVVLNQSPNKNKIENGTDAKETKQPAGAAGSATQSPGFKRQRIIKRKIIWDPVAPETAISYAQLARSTSSKPAAATAVKQQQTVKQQTVVAAAAAVKKEPVAVGTTTPTVLKKVAVIKQESKKPASPTTSVHSADATEIVVETVGGRKVIKQLNESVGNVTKSPLVFDDTRCQTPAGKRRSQTPIANGALSKKKKISEVDRLMGDEGAINMLNAVEHELNNKQKDNKEVGGEVTLETSPKHNMRSRAGAEKGAAKRDASASSQKKDTPMPSKAKRQPRSKASATWDYVYQTQQDEAMIIRRRSNSSYSSNASLHRLSLDGGPSPITPRVEQKKPAATTKAKAKTAAAAASTSTASTASPASSSSPSTVAATTSKKSSFEFAKPKNKTAAAAAAGVQTPTTPTTPKVNRRSNAKSNAAASASTSAQLSNDSPKSSELKLTTPLRNVPGNIDFIVSVAVHKFDDIWQLEFNSKATKFSVEMLDQLTDAFNRLRTADDCSVVVMSTTRTNFCQGVDLSDLLTENAEKRLNVAAEIASSTKAYLKALATFPKPIVAAVNGNVSGLGVIQLLLLDAVIAGDKSSYDTSIYNRIGQVPEGYCIWENDRKISKNLFKKLLWFGEKVSAYEAHSWGLLHKIMPATGVLEEAKTLAKKLASSYMYNEMKQRSIDRFMSEVNDVLDKEFETIVEQLASEEALENLKKI